MTIQIIASFLFPLLTWTFEPAVYAQTGNSTSVLFDHQWTGIPEKFGTVERVFQGDDRLVVFVSDLHCNFEVQQNIAGMIHELAGGRRLKLVGVEGASRAIAVDQLATYPHARVRDETAAYLCRRGKITGPEYYAVTGAHPIWLEGVESAALYQRNLATALSFLNEESQGYVCDLRESLEQIKPSVYSPTLRSFDERRRQYRDGELSLLKYAAALADAARERRVGLEAYPNLRLYIGRREEALAGGVDSDALFGELDGLDAAVRQGLYANPEERDLDRLERRLDVLERLLNISAVPEEIAELRRRPADFRVEPLLAFIERHDPTGELALDPEIVRLNRYLDQVLEFYRLADDRSQAFVENLLSRMRQHGVRISVLITGGYHRDEVLARLRAEGVSYLCVKPRLRRQDVANPYFALLKGRQTPLEKLVAKNQNILALESSFPEAGVQPTARQENFSRTLSVILAFNGIAEWLASAGEKTRASLLAFLERTQAAWPRANARARVVAESIRSDWKHWVVARLAPGFTGVIQLRSARTAVLRDALTDADLTVSDCAVTVLPDLAETSALESQLARAAGGWSLPSLIPAGLSSRLSAAVATVGGALGVAAGSMFRGNGVPAAAGRAAGRGSLGWAMTLQKTYDRFANRPGWYVEIFLAPVYEFLLQLTRSASFLPWKFVFEHPGVIGADGRIVWSQAWPRLVFAGVMYLPGVYFGALAVLAVFPVALASGGLAAALAVSLGAFAGVWSAAYIFGHWVVALFNRLVLRPLGWLAGGVASRVTGTRVVLDWSRPMTLRSDNADPAALAARQLTQETLPGLSAAFALRRQLPDPQVQAALARQLTAIGLSAQSIRVFTDYAGGQGVGQNALMNAADELNHLMGRFGALVVPRQHEAGMTVFYPFRIESAENLGAVRGTALTLLHLSQVGLDVFPDLPDAFGEYLLDFNLIVTYREKIRQRADDLRARLDARVPVLQEADGTNRNISDPALLALANRLIEREFAGMDADGIADRISRSTVLHELQHAVDYYLVTFPSLTRALGRAFNEFATYAVQLITGLTRYNLVSLYNKSLEDKGAALLLVTLHAIYRNGFERDWTPPANPTRADLDRAFADLGAYLLRGEGEVTFFQKLTRHMFGLIYREQYEKYQAQRYLPRVGAVGSPLSGALLGEEGVALLRQALLVAARIVVQPNQTLADLSIRALEPLGIRVTGGENLLQVWPQIEGRLQAILARQLAPSALDARDAGLLQAAQGQVDRLLGGYRARPGDPAETRVRIAALRAHRPEVRIFDADRLPAAVTPVMRRLGVFNLPGEGSGVIGMTREAFDAFRADPETLAAVLLHESLEIGRFSHDQAADMVRVMTGFEQARLAAMLPGRAAVPAAPAIPEAGRVLRLSRTQLANEYVLSQATAQLFAGFTHRPPAEVTRLIHDLTARVRVMDDPAAIRALLRTFAASWQSGQLGHEIDAEGALSVLVSLLSAAYGNPALQPDAWPELATIRNLFGLARRAGTAIDAARFLADGAEAATSAPVEVRSLLGTLVGEPALVWEQAAGTAASGLLRFRNGFHLYRQLLRGAVREARWSYAGPATLILGGVSGQPIRLLSRKDLLAEPGLAGAEITRQENAPYYLVAADGGWMALPEGAPVVFGQNHRGRIQLDYRISRQHLTLTCRQGEILLTDTGSTNGTFLEGAATAREDWIQDETAFAAAETFLTRLPDLAAPADRAAALAEVCQAVRTASSQNAYLRILQMFESVRTGGTGLDYDEGLAVLTSLLAAGYQNPRLNLAALGSPADWTYGPLKQRLFRLEGPALPAAQLIAQAAAGQADAARLGRNLIRQNAVLEILRHPLLHLDPDLPVAAADRAAAEAARVTWLAETLIRPAAGHLNPDTIALLLAKPHSPLFAAALRQGAGITGLSATGPDGKTAEIPEAPAAIEPEQLRAQAEAFLGSAAFFTALNQRPFDAAASDIIINIVVDAQGRALRVSTGSTPRVGEFEVSVAYKRNGPVAKPVYRLLGAPETLQAVWSEAVARADAARVRQFSELDIHADWEGAKLIGDDDHRLLAALAAFRAGRRDQARQILLARGEVPGLTSPMVGEFLRDQDEYFTAERDARETTALGVGLAGLRELVAGDPAAEIYFGTGTGAWPRLRGREAKLRALDAWVRRGPAVQAESSRDGRKVFAPEAETFEQLFAAIETALGATGQAKGYTAARLIELIRALRARAWDADHQQAMTPTYITNGAGTPLEGLRVKVEELLARQGYLAPTPGSGALLGRTGAALFDRIVANFLALAQVAAEPGRALLTLTEFFGEWSEVREWIIARQGRESAALEQAAPDRAPAIRAALARQWRALDERLGADDRVRGYLREISLDSARVEVLTRIPEVETPDLDFGLLGVFFTPDGIINLTREALDADPDDERMAARILHELLESRGLTHDDAVELVSLASGFSNPTLIGQAGLYARHLQAADPSVQLGTLTLLANQARELDPVRDSAVLIDITRILADLAAAPEGQGSPLVRAQAAETLRSLAEFWPGAETALGGLTASLPDGLAGLRALDAPAALAALRAWADARAAAPPTAPPAWGEIAAVMSASEDPRFLVGVQAWSALSRLLPSLPAQERALLESWLQTNADRSPSALHEQIVENDHDIAGAANSVPGYIEMLQMSESVAADSGLESLLAACREDFLSFKDSNGVLSGVRNRFARGQAAAEELIDAYVALQEQSRRLQQSYQALFNALTAMRFADPMDEEFRQVISNNYVEILLRDDFMALDRTPASPDLRLLFLAGRVLSRNRFREQNCALAAEPGFLSQPRRVTGRRYGDLFWKVVKNWLSNSIRAVAARGMESRGTGYVQALKLAFDRGGFGLEDNGIGMSETTLRKMFTRYFTTQNAGSGTGVGGNSALTTVRSTGGQVRVVSAAGQGTRIRAEFAAAPAGGPASEFELRLQDALVRMQGGARTGFGRIALSLLAAPERAAAWRGVVAKAGALATDAERETWLADYAQARADVEFTSAGEALAVLAAVLTAAARREPDAAATWRAAALAHGVTAAEWDLVEWIAAAAAAGVDSSAAEAALTRASAGGPRALEHLRSVLADPALLLDAAVPGSETPTVALLNRKLETAEGRFVNARPAVAGNAFSWFGGANTALALLGLGGLILVLTAAVSGATLAAVLAAPGGMVLAGGAALGAAWFGFLAWDARGRLDGFWSEVRTAGGKTGAAYPLIRGFRGAEPARPGQILAEHGAPLFTQGGRRYVDLEFMAARPPVIQYAYYLSAYLGHEPVHILLNALGIPAGRTAVQEGIAYAWQAYPFGVAMLIGAGLAANAVPVFALIAAMIPVAVLAALGLYGIRTANQTAQAQARAEAAAASPAASAPARSDATASGQAPAAATPAAGRAQALMRLDGFHPDATRWNESFLRILDPVLVKYPILLEGWMLAQALAMGAIGWLAAPAALDLSPASLRNLPELNALLLSHFLQIPAEARSALEQNPDVRDLRDLLVGQIAVEELTPARGGWGWLRGLAFGAWSDSPRQTTVFIPGFILRAALGAETGRPSGAARARRALAQSLLEHMLSLQGLNYYRGGVEPASASEPTVPTISREEYYAGVAGRGEMTVTANELIALAAETLLTARVLAQADWTAELAERTRPFLERFSQGATPSQDELLAGLDTLDATQDPVLLALRGVLRAAAQPEREALQALRSSQALDGVLEVLAASSAGTDAVRARALARGANAPAATAVKSARIMGLPEEALRPLRTAVEQALREPALASPQAAGTLLRLRALDAALSQASADVNGITRLSGEGGLAEVLAAAVIEQQRSATASVALGTALNHHRITVARAGVRLVAVNGMQIPQPVIVEVEAPASVAAEAVLASPQGIAGATVTRFTTWRRMPGPIRVWLPGPVAGVLLGIVRVLPTWIAQPAQRVLGRLNPAWFLSAVLLAEMPPALQATPLGRQLAGLDLNSGHPLAVAYRRWALTGESQTWAAALLTRVRQLEPEVTRAENTYHWLAFSALFRNLDAGRTLVMGGIDLEKRLDADSPWDPAAIEALPREFQTQEMVVPLSLVVKRGGKRSVGYVLETLEKGPFEVNTEAYRLFLRRTFRTSFATSA